MKLWIEAILEKKDELAKGIHVCQPEVKRTGLCRYESEC